MRNWQTIYIDQRLLQKMHCHLSIRIGRSKEREFAIYLGVTGILQTRVLIVLFFLSFCITLFKYVEVRHVSSRSLRIQYETIQKKWKEIVNV